MIQHRSQAVEDSRQRYKMEHDIKIAGWLKSFFFLNFLLGFNLGYRRRLKKSLRRFIFFAQILSALAITTFILSMPTYSDYRTYGVLALAIQYALYVIVLEHSKYNVYDLIEDVHILDENITRPIENTVSAVATLSFLLWLFSKSTACFTYCVHGDCLDHPIPGHLYCIVFLMIDIIPIIQVMLHYYIYRALKFLRQSLERPNVDIELVTNYYVLIADCYYKIMPLYGKMMITELFRTVPNLMGTLWQLISKIKNSVQWFDLIPVIIFLAHEITKFCVPSIVAELMNSEVDAIKRILNDILVTERDEKQTRVSHLLYYINSRHLQYKVCRVIPVDLRLVVSLFSVCTTYFIVILQFTHLV